MSSKVLFREVARPPLWLVAFIYFMLFSFVIAIWAAFDSRITLISAIAATVLGALSIISATTVIEVSGGELKVGKAHIPLRYLRGAQLLCARVHEAPIQRHSMLSSSGFPRE
jgi:hypothetical protein